jgi:hypothetical protein
MCGACIYNAEAEVWGQKKELKTYDGEKGGM